MRAPNCTGAGRTNCCCPPFACGLGGFIVCGGWVEGRWKKTRSSAGAGVRGVGSLPHRAENGLRHSRGKTGRDRGQHSAGQAEINYLADLAGWWAWALVEQAGDSLATQACSVRQLFPGQDSSRLLKVGRVFSPRTGLAPVGPSACGLGDIW